MTIKLPITATTETVIMKMDVKMVSSEYEVIVGQAFHRFELNFHRFFFYLESSTQIQADAVSVSHKRHFILIAPASFSFRVKYN